MVGYNIIMFFIQEFRERKNGMEEYRIRGK